MSDLADEFNTILPFPWPVDDPAKLYWDGAGTILHLIVSAGDAYAPYAKKALEMGADPLAMPDKVWSPLLLAAARGQVEILRALLEATGAGIVNSHEGPMLSIESLLLAAISYERPKVVQFLLESGAGVNELGQRQISPLERAVDQGNPEIADMLIKAGADVAKREKETGLSLVSRLFFSSDDSDEQRRKTIEILLKAGADPDANSSMGIPVLSNAVSRGYLDVARLLLDAGANPNIETERIFPALHYAIRRDKGVTEMTCLLLEYGANPDGAVQSRGFLICRAALEDKAAVLSLLIKAGADVNVFAENYNDTPLGVAAMHGAFDAVKTLIEAGAAIEGDPAALEAPLHKAILRGRIDIVCLLLDKGADVTKVNAMGHEPLTTAVLSMASNVIVDALLAAGADPFKKDRHDRSPYDRVTSMKNKDQDNPDLLRLLQMFEELKNQPRRNTPRTPNLD